MLSKSLLLVVLTLSSKAFAQDALSPSSFKIVDVRYSGTACPFGSAAVNTSDDQQAFTVTFSSFIAEIGPGVAAGQNRKSCSLIFDTEQESNWEFAVLGLNVRGFAQLDEGVTGRQAIKYGLQNKKGDGSFVISGPFDDIYQSSTKVGLGQLKWSGCQANKRLNDYAITTDAELLSANPDARGLWTVDSIDGEAEQGSLEQSYEIIWRQCGSSKPRYATSCSVSAIDGSGKSLMAVGTGRKEDQALQKAQKRLQRQCEKLTRKSKPHGRGARAISQGSSFACDVSSFQCSTSAY